MQVMAYHYEELEGLGPASPSAERAAGQTWAVVALQGRPAAVAFRKRRRKAHGKSPEGVSAQPEPCKEDEMGCRSRCQHLHQLVSGYVEGRYTSAMRDAAKH